MCRIFLSVNSSNPEKLIRSFFDLSLETTCTDGYGIAYVKNNKFKIYKQPFWHIEDPCFSHNIKKMSGKIYVAEVREIFKHEIDQSVFSKNLILENTAPFQYKNNIFMHHGDIFVNCTIDGENELLFYQKYRENPCFIKKMKCIKRYISNELQREIKGNTDSELLFFLFLSLYEKLKINCDGLEEEPILLKSFYRMLQILRKYKIEQHSNIIFSNGDFIIAANICDTKNPERIKPCDFYIDKTDGVLFSCLKCTETSELVELNTIHIINAKTGSCNRCPAILL
jgi:predicted glutamine amidotransferase